MHICQLGDTCRHGYSSSCHLPFPDLPRRFSCRRRPFTLRPAERAERRYLAALAVRAGSSPCPRAFRRRAIALTGLPLPPARRSRRVPPPLCTTLSPLLGSCPVSRAVSRGSLSWAEMRVVYESQNTFPWSLRSTHVLSSLHGCHRHCCLIAQGFHPASSRFTHTRVTCSGLPRSGLWSETISTASRNVNIRADNNGVGATPASLE
jgi:hypothetical protein